MHTRPTSSLAPSFLALCFAACGGGATVDGGTDAGHADASRIDTGVLDAGSVDAATMDAPSPTDASLDAPLICTDGGTACGAACVSTASDPANCGMCGHPCPDVLGATTTCTAGVCGSTCLAGHLDCDALPGCEVDSTSDRDHCGSCATVCTSGGVSTPSCTASTCGVTCPPFFGNCDTSLDNGCETYLGTSTDCAACGDACTGTTSICSTSSGTSTCTAGCMGSLTVCGSSCVDTTSDRNNCGTCGNVCPDFIGGAGVCISSACSTTCDPYYYDCNGDPTDGCESMAASDPDNCGLCGHVCPGGPQVSARSCSAGTCVPYCNYGWCNGPTEADACNAPLNTPINCGACGHVCVAPNDHCFTLGPLIGTCF